jgi:hypothetical protein
MNAELRARCLRTAYRRLVIALLPLLIVAWFVSRGQIFAASLLFCSVLTLMMIGTLVPRCALFGPMIKRLPQDTGHALLTIDDGPASAAHTRDPRHSGSSPHQGDIFPHR